MNPRFYKIIFSLLFASFLFAGCKKTYDSIEQQDNASILSYIKTTNLSFQQYATTGIYYQVAKTGNGAALDYSKLQPVIMTFRAVNGSFAAVDTFAVFNRSGDYFGYLGIRGTKITETIPQLVSSALVKKGGSIRLLIPSALLFGRNPSPKLPGYDGLVIPGNTPLDVTMTFVDDAKQAQYDDLSIQKYIQTNKLTGFVKNTFGTYYKITDPGSTTSITTASTLSVEYSGKLFDGTVFDSTPAGTPTGLLLSQLIAGWQQTLPLIKKGGTIELIIPSAGGYGIPDNTDVSGVVKIPAFSCTYFSLKIDDVN